MVKSYAKGYAAELELLHKLSGKGWMVMRAPRSGRINLASPDIVAAKNGQLVVIECKARAGAFTVQKEQLAELDEWVEKAGAAAYIGWKISRKGWCFLNLNDVKENKGNIGKKFAESKGFGIDVFGVVNTADN
ncbi:MAG: Holliday junction resolvase Hjc [Candidatus Aenigmatarchaeota archaeon]